MASTPDNSHARSATNAAAKRAAAFWSWWTNELAQLVPEALSPQGRLARLPLLAVEADAVACLGPGSPERIDTSAMDNVRARSALRTLLERAGESRGRARLALAREEALVRRVTLPLATEENLSQVLGFEMDRLTPFRAEDVYHDARVLSRDANAGTLVALLAVARRDVVDAKVLRLRELGVSVQGVSLRDEPAHPGAPLDLLPAAQRGEGDTRTERILRRSLFAAVAVLLFAVLFLPIWQKRETVIALNPLVAKAAQDAQATDAIAREVEHQIADYNFLLARKHGTYPALAYLEEVSRLLPDHTWVQELQIKNTGKTRELQIQGETNSSAKLLETLAQSALLQDVNSRGTVTRGSVPGSERFMMTAITKARAQPEAVALNDAPAAAAQPPAPAPAKPAAEPPKPATVTPAPVRKP